MVSTLKRLRDRSETLLSVNYLIGQALFRLGMRPHQSGATHQKYTVEQGTEYVRRVFDDYLSVIGQPSTWLAGKKVLEVGPGDNLGVALMFAAHGAEVHCLDRFAPLRDVEKNQAVYRRLGELSSAGPRLNLLLSPTGEPRADVVSVHPQLAVEDAAVVLPHASFDLIVSRAVLEHVADLDAAWSSMDILLRPGGLCAHKVDFRNHGFYDSLHPLAFLRQSDWLWRLVSSPDPTLNRQRATAYENLCHRCGYEFRIAVTHWSLIAAELDLDSVAWPLQQQHAAFVPELERVRPRLHSPFNKLSLQDLAVAGIFVAATKPN